MKRPSGVAPAPQCPKGCGLMGTFFDGWRCNRCGETARGVAPAAPECDSNGTVQCQELPNSHRCAACPLKLGGENCAPGVKGDGRG